MLRGDVSRLRGLALPAIAVAATAVCYLRALAVPFWADDYLWVGRALAALRDPLLPFVAVFLRDYNPLAYISFAANQWIGGTHAGPWHAVDLGVHLCCVSLVFVLSRRLGAGQGEATVASLVFGLHAAINEPVIWSSARVHSQATLCILGAALCHLSTRRVAGWLLFPLLLAMALGFKETAIAYVLLPPAHALWCRARGLAAPPGALATGVWAIAVAAAYAAFRAAFVPSQHALKSVSGASFGLAAQKVALLFAAPLGLEQRLPPGAASVAFVLLLAAAALLPRDRALGFGILYALVMELGYVFAAMHSSRYLYLPWPGIAVAAARLVALAYGSLGSTATRMLLVALLALSGASSIVAIQVEISDQRILGAACADQVARFAPVAADLLDRHRLRGELGVMFLDSSGTSVPPALIPALHGRPKLIAHRRNAVEGLITFADLVNLNLPPARGAYFERLRPEAALGWDASHPTLLLIYRGAGVPLEAREGISRVEAESLLGMPGERLTVGRMVPHAARAPHVGYWEVGLTLLWDRSLP